MTPAQINIWSGQIEEFIPKNSRKRREAKSRTRRWGYWSAPKPKPKPKPKPQGVTVKYDASIWTVENYQENVCALGDVLSQEKF